MLDFGTTLREARESKGLTPADISAQTHMIVQQVVDLENENFSRIVAPIYGRGYVKLYCEAVGLDPKPMIAEFMDIFAGNRPPTVRMKPPKSTPIPPSEPKPEPTPIPEPAPEPISEPVREPIPEHAPEPIPEPAPEPIPQVEPVVIPTPEPKPEPETNVFRRPTRRIKISAPSPIKSNFRMRLPFRIPPAAWRIGAISVIAFVALWLVISGAKAVFRIATTPPADAPAIAETQTAAPVPSTTTTTTSATTTAATRTPLPVDPLYID